MSTGWIVTLSIVGYLIAMFACGIALHYGQDWVESDEPEFFFGCLLWPVALISFILWLVWTYFFYHPFQFTIRIIDSYSKKGKKL